MSLSDAVQATHDRPSWRALVRDATCPATQHLKQVSKVVSITKKGKATGMGGIPVKAWKVPGEDGIQLVCDLMQ